MNVKLFEIRDAGTFIPVMATLIDPYDKVSPGSYYLLRRAGFGETPCVILCKLECSGVDRNATYDPYSWTGSRTMNVAHNYILENWNNLQSGEVIDVEFILEETKDKKISEAFTTVSWP